MFNNKGHLQNFSKIAEIGVVILFTSEYFFYWNLCYKASYKNSLFGFVNCIPEYGNISHS